MTPFALVVAHQIVGAVIDALVLVADRDLTQIDVALADATFAQGIAELPFWTVVEAVALFVALALAHRWCVRYTVVAFGIANQVVGAVVDALLVSADLTGENLITFNAIGAGLIAE